MRVSDMFPSACFQGGAENVEVEFLTIDSRKCKSGALYFALRGTQVDGHAFIESAYANGACAAVVEHPVDCEIPQIIVDNSRSAMSTASSLFYGEPSKKLRMIGITGTNGKTSISYMVQAIARKNNISAGVIGTGGIRLDGRKLDIPFLTATTPDPIELQYILSEMVRLGAEWVIMEVTAHALDLHKVDGMRFFGAGYTNLTQDHLDYFCTMDNYAATKAKLFTDELCDTAVINIDDEFGKKLLDAPVSKITYSINEPATLKASNIALGAQSSRFDLEYEGGSYSVNIGTTGLFNISNCLCAMGLALVAGIDISGCVEGIGAFTSVPGRFEAVPSGKDDVSVIIDYAHTPDGLDNVLTAVNAFKRGRLICVFGCGGNRDATKRSIMGRISGTKSDFVIITSDNPRFEEPESIIRSIEEGIKETKCPYICNADRFAAIAYALEMAQRGDVIAICGKGDEDYQEIKGIKHHFSDREAVEKIVKGDK